MSADTLIDALTSPQYSKDAKILFFDIETTNLKADFGYLLCIGYKWAHEKKAHVIQIHRGKDAPSFRQEEKRVLREFAKIYNQADIVVSYNGKRFDVPYLNAKMLEHNLGFLADVSHVDLYWTVKHKLGISRKSLQNAAYYLKLSNEKSPVEGRIWVDAMMGSYSALKYIVDHCRADVLVLEELHQVLRPLVKGHPWVKGYGPCKYCGSDKIQSRGRAVTTTKKPQRRIQCQACGGWDTRPLYGPLR